jgi:hypothetical protein
VSEDLWFECLVQEVREAEVVLDAILISDPGERWLVTLPLAKIPPPDREFVQLGTVFKWNPAAVPMQFEFNKELWTAEEIEEINAEAEKLCSWWAGKGSGA